ncbi:MAG: ATP synthase F1 subunit gamma [Chloroflexi bacterium]|nr:ATP synthase F1 subunit gamma [Chloroflexota bacterium]MCI0580649.1 ATP synthase F1 subunit gamma [Chloroflexota bacterium]MCI0648665.1 ATP synthase F1 subunit gamma [Chloroflexota bacterium]MCI0728073.1 ATP synthase F1 subunit gamma [Chloroflexota bacterium]
MATERELNKRIRSVKNISQVTSALAAVSAAKASKAQHQVAATRAYAGKAYEILINLASQPGVGETGHPLLTTRPTIRNTALILITGDRGLAGAYNANIVGQAERFIHALTTPAQVVAVGRKGRDLMIRRGYNVVASFDGIPDEPSLMDVSPIAQVVIDDFLAGKVDDVFIVYTDFVSLVTRIPTAKQLLPLKPLDLEGMALSEYVKHVDLTGVAQRVYSYEPEPAVLLNTIVPRFTELQIYQAVLEAKASEHSARMVAMNNATDNAAELIDILILERNKARQSNITSEILDIVGGAEALRSR